MADDANSQTKCQSIEDIDAIEILINNNDGDGDGDCSVQRDSDVESLFGKTFASMEDAHQFYNQYAFSKGFGTRIHYANRKASTNEIYRRQFVCNKQGFKDLKDKRQIGKEPKRIRETRTGCEALMQIILSKPGEWVVDKFYDVHNHPLSTTPSKVIKHRSHNNFHRTIAGKALISELNQSGLRPTQIPKAVNVTSGSGEVDITSAQYSGILCRQRKNNVGQICHGIIKHFQEKANSDGSYYFAVDLAENGSLRSVFWADGRSRASFAKFGDVVVFDMTYKTNKFRMPFAPFVGVNHHRQTILFGAALLEDEIEATFVWLFEHFRRCMFDREPTAVITDQDGAMDNAIAKVFPNARHRFCAWHIKKHVLENIQSYRARYSDFDEAHTKWVKSGTITEFELGWKILNEKYEIGEKSWLANMYNLRRHWAKAYLKDVFLAGMTTSGRSVSIHSFFDGYVNSNTMLNEFVVQYDKAVNSRRVAEEDEDFKTMNSKAVLFSGHPLEAKAGQVYTRNLFEIFKKEWKATFNCCHETLSKEADVIKYSVGFINAEKGTWKIVDYSSGGAMVTCSCAKFETEGIMCKHILYIMKKKQLTALPDHYILLRWTINARYKVGNIGCGLQRHNENQASPLTSWSIRAKFIEAIEDARDSPSDVEKLDVWLDSFLEEQAVRKKVNQIATGETISQVASCANISQVESMPQICVCDPAAPVKTKGRPKIAKRLKSGMELSNKAKKTKNLFPMQG